MQAKVCRNCLQPLSAERKEKALSTCANCAKQIAAAQQKMRELENPPPKSPLHATLRGELEKQAQMEAQRIELEKKQKNVEHFFDDFQKVKKSFW